MKQTWHPFTQHCLVKPEIKITKGEAAYLYDEAGRKILDAISSWWVNLHGHSHPTIAEAIAKQAKHLEHVIFSGFTHEPAEELSSRLLKIAPPGLSHVFYSDNGSTAVEVALKMAVGYWHNQGFKNKTQLVALDKGYHGDTCGAMSVSARGPFTAMFSSLMFDVKHLPFPENGNEQATIDKFSSLLENSANEIAAFIVEPLVLGAGGMKMYSCDLLRQLYDLCQQYNVLFIADEIMTGFGRTGTMFACEQASITPDLMCISKGITGGFLPLSATLTNEKVYQAFYSKDRSKTFFHGHSYTANPIACAAANANLDVFQQ